jgi:septal ring factor EnvC (AmiA/AmiB activator)
MERTKIPAAALVFSLVLALATPGFADSLDQRRNSAQAKRAEAAAKLNTLRADDQQLESAVRELDTHVSTQSSTTEAAQQAASVAQSAVGSAQARLAATEQRMAGLRRQAAAIAIRAYVHPGSDALLEIIGSRDLAEASRRETLLAHVASSDHEVLGQLRSTREDQQAEQSDLARLRDQAEARRKAAADRLAELVRARNDQARLKAALDTRIQEYTGEVDALSREQSNIEGLIRARQAASPSPAPGAAGAAAPRHVQERAHLAGVGAHHVGVRDAVGPHAHGHRHRRRLRRPDPGGQGGHGHLRRRQRRVRPGHDHRPWWRVQHPLRAPEPDPGQRRQRVPGPGHRLRRVHRPLHRPPRPLRDPRGRLAPEPHGVPALELLPGAAPFAL